MARINIEDCWWTDPRRSLLIKKVGSEELADGAIIRAWRLAQEFWKSSKGLVPFDLFETLPYFQNIIDSKLADVRESFVYVRGSSAYLDWVREKKEQASEAGKKSAEIRKLKHGSAQPKRGNQENKSENTERTPNDSRTEFNDSEPSDSGSISGSTSDYNSKENIISSEPKNSVAEVTEKTKKEMVEFKISENKGFLVTKDLVKSWAETYPKEFLELELKKAKNWILANEQRAPKSQWGKFLNSWFNNGWDNYRKTLKSNPVALTTEEAMSILRGGL